MPLFRALGKLPNADTLAPHSSNRRIC
jgi:hypothetical protein